ncbi:MAG: hypothetical protein R3C01_11690 [Planctomycetaceae bacterium]
MARKRGDNGETISLFPFLSILCCLIGVLTLLIVGVTLSQMGRTQSKESVERFHAYQEANAQIASTESKIEEIKQLIAAAEKLDIELKRAEEEAKRLQSEESQMTNVNSELVKLLSESNRLKTRLVEIEKLPADFAKQIAELEKEIEAKKKGPEEAIVQVRPGGSGVDIDPTFVEVTATGVMILHRDKTKNLRIVTSDLDKPEKEFVQLLDTVSAKPKGQIIFLIRPDAVGVYNRARGVARSHIGPNGYCKNGKLPVPSQGQIDLSVFLR